VDPYEGAAVTGTGPVANDATLAPPAASTEAAVSAERFAAALTVATGQASGAAPPAVTSAVSPPAGFGQFVTLGQMATGSPSPSARAFGASAFGAAFASATGTVGASLPPASGRGAEAIQAASQYLGVPYRWGGTNPATGLDCSGFLQRAFADIGVSLPRVSVDQSRAGVAVPSLAEAQPGDLVYWGGGAGRPNHIGIYLGDGQMMHAPRTGDVVKVAPVRSAPPDAIRRVL
jgi:cell wall-associated NlpC family hydrolase